MSGRKQQEHADSTQKIPGQPVGSNPEPPCRGVTVLTTAPHQKKKRWHKQTVSLPFIILRTQRRVERLIEPTSYSEVQLSTVTLASYLAYKHIIGECNSRQESFSFPKTFPSSHTAQMQSLAYILYVWGKVGHNMEPVCQNIMKLKWLLNMSEVQHMNHWQNLVRINRDQSEVCDFVRNIEHWTGELNSTFNRLRFTSKHVKCWVPPNSHGAAGWTLSAQWYLCEQLI